LQQIADNPPISFTDLKDVIKSFNLAKNAPKKGNVPIKTTQVPAFEMRRSSMASPQD
jgi:hypothetical protein